MSSARSVNGRVPPPGAKNFSNRLPHTVETKILLEGLLSLKLGTYQKIQWTSGEENSPTLSEADSDEKENLRSDHHGGQGAVVLDEIEGYSDDEKEPPKKRQRRSNDGTSSKNSRPRKSSAGSKRKAAGKRRR